MKQLLKMIKRIVKRICISIYVIAVSILKSVLTLLIGKTSRFEEEPDKTIFVIGNGPSLNDTDLKIVAESGFDIVCVNSFPERHNEFWVLKPRYLALFDPLFFVSPGEAGYEAGLFDVLEKVDWEMKVLVPQGVVLHVQNPYLQLEYVNNQTVCSEFMGKYLDWFYKRNLLDIGKQNVMVGVCYYFISKKVKQIYLTGVDMSEFKQLYVDEKNCMYVERLHSYGTEREYVTWVEQGEFHRLLLLYQKMFQQFYYIAQYAKRQNVKVENLSLNSYIDVFEKADKFRKEAQE